LKEQFFDLTIGLMQHSVAFQLYQQFVAIQESKQRQN